MSGPILTCGVLTLTVWSLLTGGMALLVARRLAGAFDAPPSVAALAMTGCLLALLAHWARVILPVERPSPQRGRRQVAAHCVALGIAACGAAAVSLPNSAPLGLLMLWSPLLLESVAGLRELRSSGETAATVSLRDLVVSAFRARRPARDTRLVRHSQVRERATRPRVHPSLSLVRWELADSDSLKGRVLVRLPVGRRTASAHVAFCPPFAGVPSVQIKARPRSGMDVTVGQVLPHGARFDVKLSANTSRPLTVPIEFSANGPGLPLH